MQTLEERAAVGSHMDRLFRPRSIALVGASERSLWSVAAHDNLLRFGFPGPIYAVNPKGGHPHGLAAAVSLAALGEEVDAALLMVPEAALADALDDLGAANVGGAVILSAGFAETGAEGSSRQAALARQARDAGIRIIGPNCLGFANFVDRTPLWTTPLRRGLADPRVAIVSQSGAIAGQLEQFAYQQGVGLTHLISTGNEADVTVADAIEFLVAQPQARAIAVFLETVRDPERFLDAVAAANAADKSVILLKVGSSEAAAKAAQAHTGSLVGNDRMFDAMCRQNGLVRVRSLEELIVTADIFSQLGRVGGKGPGLIALSGGLCEIAIDQAEEQGIPLPELSAATRTGLKSVLPGYATPNNPLDITGGAMTDPAIIEPAIEGMARDPDVGLVTFTFDVPEKDDARGFASRFINRIGAGFANSGKPGLLFSHAFSKVNAEARAMAVSAGLAYSGGGLRHCLTAIGHLFRWSKRTAPRPRGLPTVLPAADRPLSERAVLSYLEAQGVSVVPVRIARSADEAASMAAAIDAPVVLKIASPDIAHKTEIGGVVLNLSGEAAVREAFAAILERAATHCPDARIDGVIVAPMRDAGVELFVGTLRDPQWGLAIAVGLGGIFVEALKDTSLRLLPIMEQDALGMLEELRSKALLDGFRGAEAVDRQALARAIVKIGDAALALGPDLVSLEVNPLLASGSHIEALDGLAIWNDDDAE